MTWLAILVIAGLVIWYFASRDSAASRTRPPRDHELTKPDNPRFATWEEALNRAVSGNHLFRIEYADADGVVSQRDITPKSIHLIRGQPDLLIKAHCHLRNEERTFRSDRILSCRNMKTGRVIGDLGQYLRSRN